MKNYFNKIIIMFVMALGIIGFNYTSAFAEDTNQSIKINNTNLNFNRVIYVSISGNDSTGDGSESNPFLTFDKAYENAPNDSAIILGDGTFNTDNYAQNYINSSKAISVIGNADKTILNFPSSPDLHFYPVGTIKFYRLTITFRGENLAGICGDGVSPATANIYFYNVNFIDNSNQYPIDGGNYTSLGTPSRFNVYAYNSNFKVASSNMFANFTISNVCSNQPQFIANEVSTITSNQTPLYNVTYDDKYEITNKEWKNKGTGSNPDGTQANIGVYGGEFAWGNWNLDRETITLDKSILSLPVGDSKDLIATTTPAAVDIDWSSSDETVATVDSNGNVKAIKEGQSTITAKIKGTDIKSTCIVTVTKKDTVPEPVDPEQEYIINTANAKGDNTNNASGSVSIKFNGTAETTLSVVKTADVKEVWVGDTFTYTIVVTNTGSKTAKAVVINDSAPNHIDFIVDRATTTKGKVNKSSTSKNIVINVGDIEPSETVTIKIPVNVIA